MASTEDDVVVTTVLFCVVCCVQKNHLQHVSVNNTLTPKTSTSQLIVESNRLMATGTS